MRDNTSYSDCGLSEGTGNERNIGANSSLARLPVRSARIFLEFSRGESEKSDLFCNLFGMKDLEEKMSRMSDSLLQTYVVAEVVSFCVLRRCCGCCCFFSCFFEDEKIMS